MNPPNDNSNFGLGREGSPREDTNIIGMDDLSTSDTECSSSHNDYSSTKTETMSSEESDLPRRNLKMSCKQLMTAREFTEYQRVSVLILSYIAKHKFNGSTSSDHLDLLKLIAPGDKHLDTV